MQAQTPDGDSLKRFSTKYMKSAINAFSYNRLNTLIHNIINLVDTSSGGGSGSDAREIALRNSGGFIQWQYDGDASWTNLISTAALTGPQGIQGIQGVQGIQGSAGSNATATTDASALVTGILPNTRLSDIPLAFSKARVFFFLAVFRLREIPQSSITLCQGIHLH